MTHLRLQQSSPVPLGAVGFAFDGAEVPADQLGLPVLAGRLLSWPGVRVLRDPQSLELDLDVCGRAALLPSLVVVLVVVAQNVALFDETVGEVGQALVGVFLGVLSAPGQGQLLLWVPLLRLPSSESSELPLPGSPGHSLLEEFLRTFKDLDEANLAETGTRFLRGTRRSLHVFSRGNSHFM